MFQKIPQLWNFKLIKDARSQKKTTRVPKKVPNLEPMVKRLLPFRKVQPYFSEICQKVAESVVVPAKRIVAKSLKLANRLDDFLFFSILQAEICNATDLKSNIQVEQCSSLRPLWLCAAATGTSGRVTENFSRHCAEYRSNVGLRVN